MLWTVAPSLVFFLFVYAVLGTWLTTSVFGKRLMQLQYLLLQKEGDLRFDLVRTRENSGAPILALHFMGSAFLIGCVLSATSLMILHCLDYVFSLGLAVLCSGAESIAFYNGEKHEENCATLRLALLVAVARIRIIWSTFLSLWTNFYQHATILLPSLLTAPRYFEGKIEFGVITQVTSLVLQHLLQCRAILDSEAAAHSFEVDEMWCLLQVSFAFSRIESALNYILNHLQELSGLAAEAERLDALLSGGLSTSLHASPCEGVQLLYLPAASLMIAPNHLEG